MKKSLILSIVMTLVLVISMSTATFAWYTANSKVTANINTITATTASGNLTISIGSGNYGTSASEEISGTWAPAMPTASMTSTITGDATKWLTGSISINEETSAEELTLSLGDAQSVVPAVIRSINIKNDANEDAENIILTAPTQTNLAWVLLDSTGAVYAASAYKTYATAYSGAVASIQYTSVDAIAPTTFTVKKNDTVSYTLVAWFQGDLMDNADQGTTENITLAFAPQA